MITRETWSQEEEPLYLEKVYYYHNDHLGTAMKLTNEAGEVKWDTNYVPFGATFGTGAVGVTNYFRFPGQYEDELTALYYNHHRYYVPDVGRYNRVDPLKTNGGDHFEGSGYVYSSNNPVLFFDPTGLAVYRGTCIYISGGAVGGLGYMSCDVMTKCSQQNKQAYGKLRTFFSGATAGIPVGLVCSNIQQEDSLPGIGSIYSMGGSSSIVSASFSLGLGTYRYRLKLGNTLSTSEKWGTVQAGPQAGIDLSGDLFIGFSWLSDVKERCCNTPGGWR